MTYEEAVVRSAVNIIVRDWEQGLRTLYGEMRDLRYHANCVLYEVAKHPQTMEMLSEKLDQHNLCVRVTCLYQEDALPMFVFDLDWIRKLD